MQPIISVVIPCYNGGAFIEGAVANLVPHIQNGRLEVIIINDGSTDETTINKLRQLEQSGLYKIIHQPNLGLASARNTGIANAKALFILPLDCDNQIFPEIFFQAAAQMMEDESIGVIYTNAEKFGKVNEAWPNTALNIHAMLHKNRIDACALIRKSCFESFGGYDPNMPVMGHEDWELWIRFYFANVKLQHLNKVGFRYYVHDDAMTNLYTRHGVEQNRAYIFSKNGAQIASRYADVFYSYRALYSFLIGIKTSWLGRLRRRLIQYFLGPDRLKKVTESKSFVKL